MRFVVGMVKVKVALCFVQNGSMKAQGELEV